jgi:hypothetical protein
MNFTKHHSNSLITEFSNFWHFFLAQFMSSLIHLMHIDSISNYLSLSNCYKHILSSTYSEFQ